MTDAAASPDAPDVTAERSTPPRSPGPAEGAAPLVDRFAELYRTDHDRLVRLAGLILGSATAAEDVVQDAFAKLHGQFERVHNPGGWLRVAVINGCRNEGRRLGRARRHAHRLTTPTATEALVTPELIASLRRLPMRQRTALVLRFYEDLPEAEIARVMGVRVGTVKSTLHRALAKLREDLDP